MIVLKLISLMLFISVHQCRLPDKVYCVNPECSEPISKAKTILSYNSGDKDLMSFRGNAEATIYMKSAGTHADLWYANIDGKSGFVTSKFLRENKIYVKDPQHVLPVQVRKKQPENEVQPNKVNEVQTDKVNEVQPDKVNEVQPDKVNEVQPDKVQQAHEVFEGTTIYSTEPTAADQVTTAPPATTSDQYTPSLDKTTPRNIDNVANKTDNDNSLNQNIEQLVSRDNQPIVDANNILNAAQTDIAESVTTPSAQDVTNTLKTPSTEPEIHATTLTPDTADPNTLKTDNTEIPTTPPPYIPEIPTTPPPHIPEIPTTLPTNIPETSSQSIDTIPSTTETPEILLQPGDSTAGNIQNQDMPTFTEANVDKTPVERIIYEIVKESGEIDHIENSQELPGPSPESVPPLQPISSPSGDALASETVKMPKNDDLFPQTVTQTELDNEQNISANSLSNIDSQLPQTSTQNVPDSNTYTQAKVVSNQVPEIQQYDNGLFGNIFNQGGNILDSINGIPQEAENQLIVPKQDTQDLPTTDNMVLSSTLSPEVVETVTEQIPESITTEPPPSVEYSSTTPIADSYPIENGPNQVFVDDSVTIRETPSTEETNGDGFMSNMFKTITDMWPSTTETPVIESLYTADSNDQHAENINMVTNEEFSFINYLWSTYNSVMGPKEEMNVLFSSAGEPFSKGYCDGGDTDQHNRLLTFLLTTASSVLLFCLGYYYIDNRRQDSKLIGKINSLQRNLLFTTKECEILKEELLTTKSKLAGIEDNSFGMDDMVQSLKEEINELEAQNQKLRNSLDDNEKLLRVSENTAGELQNTLSEVENTLSELFSERANAEDQIAELNGKIQTFEEELISVTRDRDNFQLKYVSTETALEEYKKQKKQLEVVNEKLKEATDTIQLQKHEIVALKDALKNGVSTNVDVGSLIDHTEIKAKLAKALEEKTFFERNYEMEHSSRARLADELHTAQESLRTSGAQATEALTRLEVLGKYFQERESELLKELATKESLFLSKQGESASTVEKMELLQQEIQRHKEKCDALTLELAEQESQRRTAVSEVEGRAHAAWLEARAARRDADAARDDAAALRRKLAAVSAADGAASPHRQVSSPLENSDSGVLPPPLPPLAFLPPLLPPLPRPPPLGRLPSPHPPRYSDRRYSPDSRYSPRSRYSPESRYSPPPPGGRYSPPPARYSPDSRYSPRAHRTTYSPRSRRRSRDRYPSGGGGRRGSRARTGPADTETEYNSDSPSREPRRRRRYSQHSGSSGSGCSSESDK